MSKHPKIEEALSILKALKLPKAQQNGRSALCLLALCDMRPDCVWKDATAKLLGITPMMEWFKNHYQKDYAPNTRETVRRQTIHQFMAAGIVQYNPDTPDRAVNSPKAVYAISPEALSLIRSFGTSQWQELLAKFLDKQESLVERYAQKRSMSMIPINLADGQHIDLSPGSHSELIQKIVTEFAPRFAPGCSLVYVGDTGEKWAYFDSNLLSSLGVSVDAHGKMPDVILYSSNKNWLFLVESVTSHGPMDGKRHEELARLFINARGGLVYVTAFATRNAMAKYLAEIAWETEVWVADTPDHLIHFNGDKFLGPHKNQY